MRMLIIICLIAAAASATPAADTREHLLGDLAITYDPAHWKFGPVPAGDLTRVGGPESVRAICLDCFGDGFVTLSVADIVREESEAVTDPTWARDRRHSSLTVGEMTIGITEIHSPCRNYVPSSLTGRTAYRGRTYTFRSGTVVGCHGSTGVGNERFEELLRGLHPRG